jgi:hypothetical protein
MADHTGSAQERQCIVVQANFWTQPLVSRPRVGDRHHQPPARRRFIYLAVILEAYTRAVRGWALIRTLDEDLTLVALEMALGHATPTIFHSD